MSATPPSLQSMTGYGLGKASNSRFRVHVELKAVNSKFNEFYLKLPNYYFAQELDIKNLLAQRLYRGKVSMHLTVESLTVGTGVAQVGVNQEVLLAYYQQLDALRQSLQLIEPVSINALLSLPQVVRETEVTIDSEEWELVYAAINQATDALIATRRAEGKRLTDDLKRGLARIRELLEAITPFEQARLVTLKQKIRSGIAELAEVMSIQEDRFQQELFYYLEKYDIHEERVRLLAHLDQFDEELLQSTDQHGRKLIFLTQEMNREANTLGVKAYDAQIQFLVVCMKEEIEKLKEQLMNVL
jgi:uncharacterized protein (TIGR00255 family)